MNLKEFVSETLKEIIAGIKDAQVFAAENDACINPNQFGALTSPRHILDMGDGTVSVVQPVQFDVCVTHTKKGTGKLGIEIVSGNKESIKGTESRIKFSVAVSLPRMKPNFSTKNPDYGISEVDKIK